MYDKSQGCTVVVQAVTGFYNNPSPTLCYVYMLNIFHYAVHAVRVMDGRFQ